MNRATLIGYLAKDADVRSTRNGLNFTVLTLAVNFLNCCDWPFAKSITYEMLPTIIPATSSTIVATGRSFL